jgi:hypothetical protein
MKNKGILHSLDGSVGGKRNGHRPFGGAVNNCKIKIANNRQTKFMSRWEKRLWGVGM